MFSHQGAALVFNEESTVLPEWRIRGVRGQIPIRRLGGTTFPLTLPFDGCDENETITATVPAETPRPESTATQRPLRILLVEDHADTAMVLSRILRRMGHEVLAASKR